MENLSQLLSVKSETFNLKNLDLKVKQKQLTISEYREYLKINEQKDFKETMFYALEKSMVDPKMVTREEFFSDDLVPLSELVFQEIFLNIPKIGKSKKEVIEYEKMMSDLAVNIDNKTEEEIEEEVEKK